MAERAVFLDRDNTLIDNDGYLGDPSKVKLLPGAATALAALRGLGYRLIVVTNQSGVARGMFTEADVEAVNNEVSRQLREKAGAYIDASYYCPYHPEAPIAEFRADHDWRKPKPGMLLQAAADFGLDLSQSWMVGDQGRDVAAGVAAGCRTILLKDSDVNPATGAEEDFSATPSYVVKTLADAARIIAREGREGRTLTPANEQPEPAPEIVQELPEIKPAKMEAVKEKPAEPKALESKPEAREEIIVTDRETENRITQAMVAPMDGKGMATGNGISRLEQHLDELILQMRAQHRHADLRPDFTFSNMAALILQVFAVVAVVIGLAKYFTAPATFLTAQDSQFAMMAHLAALFWIMTAVFVEGLVVALLVYMKNK